MNRMGKILILAICLLFIGGCAAYPLIIAGGAALEGLGVYKMIQLSSGGKIKVRIADKNLSEEERQALQSLKILAVYPSYPGNKEGIALAEVLSKNTEYDIIAPYSVKKVLPELDKFVNFEEMVEDEKTRFAYNLCKDLKADGLFVFFTGKGEVQGGFIPSPKREEMKTKFKVELFSKDGKIIWACEGDFAVEISLKMPPPEEEIAKILASNIVEKFLKDSSDVSK